MKNEVIQNRYHLLEQVFIGSSVDIYKATDLSFPRTVAFHSYQLDSNARGSYQERIKLLAQLCHPHIVSIYDMMEDDGSFQVVTEYTDEKKLHGKTDSSNPLTFHKVIEMTVQLCSAIAHAHSFQIMHGQLTHESVKICGGGVKVSFLPTSEIPVAGTVQKDLFNLGIILEKWFSMAISESPEQNDRVFEAIDRLVNRKFPPYGNALEALYDWERIWELESKSVTIFIEPELDSTKPFVVDPSYIERHELLGKRTEPSSRFTKRLWYVPVGLLTIAFGIYGLIDLKHNTHTWDLQTEAPPSASAVLVAPTHPDIKITDVDAKPPAEKVEHVEPTNVIVPDLIGLKKSEAENLLLQNGIRYSYFVEKSDQPEGTVFKQDKDPWSQVHKGERITFLVSDGK